MGIFTLNGDRFVLNGATISLFGPDLVAEAFGTLNLSGAATAVAPASGQAAGTLGLDGAAAALALARAQASGALGLEGSGTISAPALEDFTTGRLAFATANPRSGRILNTRRVGRVLNPVRRGTIMEIA